MEIKVLASGSKGNAYYVSDGKNPLLLECGIPWKQIQVGLDFKTSELAGVLITHEHKDHCKAISDVLKAGIDVYASAGTIQALGLSNHSLHAVRPLEQFKVGTWTILPFDTQHDATEPIGFLLQSNNEKLLYATDTYYLKYQFKGLTHIMIECNYATDILNANLVAGGIDPGLKNRIIKSHFSLENVKEFLRSNDLSQVRELWLIHLSDGNSDAERFKKEIQQLTGKPVYIA